MEPTRLQTMLAKHGRDPGSVFPLVFFHVGAVFAPLFFTWEGVVIAFVLFALTGIGISVGFHRFFNHGAFRAHRSVQWVLALLGGLAMQSHVRWWVLMHRMHHKWADEDGDPHSPAHGFFWAHVEWITAKIPPEERERWERQFIPDLLKDPVLIRVCHFCEIPLHILVALTLFFGGWLYGGWEMGASWLLWGVFLRVVLLLHVTWSVNSVGHRWGYRNYETKDTSRNSPFIAFLSLGEWLHNNHHQSPSAANFGRRWWELDLGYRVIQLLELCGLAWDVKREPHLHS